MNAKWKIAILAMLGLSTAACCSTKKAKKSEDPKPVEVEDQMDDPRIMLMYGVPFPDGEMYKEVTPENYVEGPFMFIRDGKYYFMWSEGGWTGPDYRVAYAIADSPFGPFESKGVILQQDPEVATGAGHHSVMYNPRKDQYYMVYHRRPLGSNDGNNRETCIDLLEFDEQGNILPVKITFEGVKKAKL